MFKTLDNKGKVILIAVITAVLFCLMFSSCATSKYGCPATSGKVGYHAR